MIKPSVMVRAAALVVLAFTAGCSSYGGAGKTALVQVPMTEASYQNLYGVHAKDDCAGITGAVCGNAL